MAYRINYRPVRKLRGREGQRLRLPALTGLCFLLFLALVHSLWPEGREYLRSALDTMATHLHRDASVMEALAKLRCLIPA